MSASPEPGKDHYLSALPLVPRNAEGPVFKAPWEAQAFAMTLRLHQAGHFTWAEWASALSLEIKRAQAGGDPDLGDSYYRHWMRALERLTAEKGLVSPESLQGRAKAWRRAHDRTPHGQPIVLSEADKAGV